MELTWEWEVRIIGIELQIGEQIAVDSTFDLRGGYEESNTASYNEQVLRGGYDDHRSYQ